MLFDVHKELLELDSTKFCELIPLSGSLYYSLADAFYNAFNKALPQTYLGVRRNFRDNNWVAECSYRNLDSLPENPFLLIADTIATGSTLLAVLDEIKHELGEEKLSGIAIFSIAAGIPGVKLMKKVENMFNDVPVYMFLANAIFGLEDNGTDMPWLHHETITTPFILEKAVDNYGYYLAEKWCPIWDWGNRSNNPLRHLIEMKEIIEKYKEDTSEFKQKLHFFEEKIATQIQSMQHKLNLKY